MDDRGNEKGDDGRAYGRATGTPDRELTAVGPGTPCGELMRRYWQPIALSANVTMRPQNVRVLGEDLVLFRDGKGRPGLLTPRCAHRGTSLYYGKVDENGIRCCYHGWQYDVEGRCVDQPCEPDGGRKDLVRQPWYPVEERYGLVFAYLGPPARRPVLTRWDVLENLEPGEEIYAYGNTGFGVGADNSVKIIPWSWLQNWENLMDPFHVPMLHARHRAIQYTPEAAFLPKAKFETFEFGVSYTTQRKSADGRDVDRVSVAICPGMGMVPDQQLEVEGQTRLFRWMVPVDDENHVLFYAMRVPKGVDGADLFMKASRPRPMGTSKLWSEMTKDEHQHFPTDWEAQIGQGRISAHSDEHLATSDTGIAMLRQFLRQQIAIVQNGGDPAGVRFDPRAAVNKVRAGNAFRDAKVPA